MKEVIRKILLVIFLGIFLYAAYNLATIGFKYYKVDKDTKAVKETYVKQIDDSNDPLKRKIDFTALKQKNADVVGWLYIPGTKIDEVVLKGANNDTYLHHNIDKQYSFAGELFVENVNNANFKDVQTVIYGHNMKNGSRFHDLRYFVESDTFKKYNKVYLYLPDGSVNVYTTYVGRVLNANSSLYYNNASYQEVISAMQNKAAQVNEVSKEEAPLLMLSTCLTHDDPRRYVLGARLDRNVVIS